MRVLRTHWVLLSVTCIGVFLRFTNLNWDLGSRLHPDEALIVNGSLAVTFFSQLSPGFHDYNGLSVYLLKAASLITSFLFQNPYWSGTPEGLTIIGRFVSALFSTLSIPLLYVFGKQLWKKEVGIIAAILFSFTPLVIQLAHFYTTESILIFLLLTLLCAATLYTKNPTIHALVRMAVPMGLLLATKNTAYLFLPIAVAILWLHTKRNAHKIYALILFFIGCITSFFIASPYSFIDLPGYVQRSRYLADVVSGRLLMDWTMQFQNTNGLFWIPNFLYAFGPVSVVGIVGIIGNALHTKNRRGLPFILTIWSIFFLLFIAQTYLKFTRYAAPLTPFFALFAAKLLWDLRKTFIRNSIFYGIIGVQILAGLMYFSIYTTPHTSLIATRWIRDYVPPSSVIFTEEWNSIIRFSHPDLADKKYRHISFNLYSLPDDTIKTHYLREALAQSHYVILESPKVKNTVTRLQNRYPSSAVFYEALESRELGFTKVAEFTSFPRIGHLAIDDRSAEETLTVFDHPVITIYRKTGVCAPGSVCR